jgi:ABC-2 type transport system ATP-binding protein
MDDTIAIKVHKVDKQFKLPHEKVSSIKSFFTQSTKRRDKGFEIQKALSDVSFEVKKGEFFGIVGRNGSGKSTLLKILAEIYQPTKGSVATSGRLVPFIELGVGFNPELTGRENVYLNGALLGFTKTEINEMYHDIVEFAELEKFMDQKLKNYSSGMQVRLAFSVATRSKADILLVDEVLAVGDADFQRKCFNYFKQLKKEKKTVVFVSHDMNAVRDYCDRAILIEKSKVIRRGKVSEVASAYTKLFMEDSQIKKDDSEGRIRKKRWGNQCATFTDINIHPQKITDTTDTISISTTYEVKEDISSPIFGFALKNSAGTAMCGTNSKILGRQLSDMSKGKRGKITWSIPNILNEGEYSVDIAVSSDDESTQYDWWEDAATFAVLRRQHTHYAVEPPIELKEE